ncbi:hypothetical protein LTR36_009394 [Oleoguttula mirabilis]|uniref:PPIase cyclophilin-type domain-containing protein n=1 Tax=Oleoguttula mirabilis TaxID=1507867 RepID=A0AAV9JT79_9PEZI|nr:hypothetical protein LTR36_009394 [Oleoguttula mirabilis]
MSALYNLEPQPTAKVVLNTTSGDLLLDLWSKQAPLATRNFLQHCLDGYYNGTIFHRLVPSFIVQGGDPTGSGHGGESALGEPFADEVHSRLKFNRRGLLGMANEGKDSNGSQFFLTLGATPELQGKHTMFGRVEGETIYNLMKMGDVELVEGEGSERPLYPTKVTGAEILVNPFEDMVARAREAPRVREEGGRREVKKRKKPAGKNVLSFGGEEGDDETAAPVLKKVKANPKLVSVGLEEPERLNNTKMPGAPPTKQRERRKERAPSPEADDEVVKTARPLPVQKPTADLESEDEEPEQPTKSRSTLDKTNAEIAALKASMKRTVDTAPKEKHRPKNALEAMIPSTSTRGRKRGKVADERGAIDMFKAFKTRLEDLPPEELPISNDDDDKVAAEAPTNGGHSALPTTAVASASVDNNEDDEETALCDLHFIANCQSCASWDAEDKPDAEAEADGEDGVGATWMSHSLTFAKDTLGKDLEWKRKMAEIEVIDPREKARVLQGERRKEKGGGSGSGGKAKR